MKNRAIEFYRFLFCCIIFMLHSRHLGNFPNSTGQFSGAYLGVEFFFIVSGFLMMKKMQDNPCPENGEAKDTVHFLVGRYRRLYPAYLLSLLLILAWKKWYDPLLSLKDAVFFDAPEFLALQIFWSPYLLNRSVWFVSALIWASFLVYYACRKYGDTFLYIIEPTALLLFIAVISRRFGYLDLTVRNILWISGIRAFVEIGLGCCIFSLCSYLERAEIRLPGWFCSVAEILLLAIILYVMYTTKQDYKDFIMIGVIAVFVLFTFLNRGILSKILDNRLSAFLGSISYEMYLNQMLIIKMTGNWFSSFHYLPATMLRLLLLGLIAWLEKQFLCALKTRAATPIRRFFL